MKITTCNEWPFTNPSSLVLICLSCSVQFLAPICPLTFLPPHLCVPCPPPAWFQFYSLLFHFFLYSFIPPFGTLCCNFVTQFLYLFILYPSHLLWFQQPWLFWFEAYISQPLQSFGEWGGWWKERQRLSPALIFSHTSRCPLHISACVSYWDLQLNMLKTVHYLDVQTRPFSSPCLLMTQFMSFSIPLV